MGKRNGRKGFDVGEYLASCRPALEDSLENLMNAYGLEYAWATLLDRALVDRSGLKPVHLRSLWGMFKLGLRPDVKNMKQGTVTADIMGKYHPHSDTSIKGVIDGWAQPFKSRVPLVKYTGSVGIATGDTAAAARYLEVGLNEAGWELIKDLRFDACRWTFNEQGDLVLPLEMPVSFPVGVINGSEGIATGFASCIPPHNPDEVLKACVGILEGRVKCAEDVCRFVKGPDFPTGGLVLGSDGVRDYIVSGRGRFVVRGRFSVEDAGRSKVIVFSELPYQVSVESVISAISKCKGKGRFGEVSEVKDLTDRRFQTDKCEVRLAVYLKSGASVEDVLADLFRFTPCEVSFNVNSTVLVDNVPHPDTSLFEMLQGFLDLRRDCYRLRSEKRLKTIGKEVHYLDGLLKVLVDIDRVIAIIRGCDNAKAAVRELVRVFGVDKVQAEEVLSTQLRKLTKADSVELSSRLDRLVEERSFIEGVLADEGALVKELVKELKQVLKVVSSPRRSEIVNVSSEELAVEAKAREVQDRQVFDGKVSSVFVNVDSAGRVWQSRSAGKDCLFEFSDAKGFVFTVDAGGVLKSFRVDGLPSSSGSGFTVFDGGVFGELVRGGDGFCTVVATDKGYVNIVKGGLREGRLVAMQPDERVIAVKCLRESELGDWCVNFVDASGRLVRFPVSAVRSTRQGAGLIIGCSMDDSVVGCVFSRAGDVLLTETAGEVKYTSVDDCPVKGRGGKGYILHKLAGEPVERVSVCGADGVSLSARGRRGVRRG